MVGMLDGVLRLQKKSSAPLLLSTRFLSAMYHFLCHSVLTLLWRTDCIMRSGLRAFFRAISLCALVVIQSMNFLDLNKLDSFNMIQCPRHNYQRLNPVAPPGLIDSYFDWCVFFFKNFFSENN